MTLTADGYFTDKGIRVAFLQECAETTLKDGYDSFELLSYLVREKPGHKEASGSIKVSKGPPPAATRNTFDARKVLADKGF